MARLDSLVAVRYPEANRRLVQLAAERRRITVSEFIRQATMAEAVEVVTDGSPDRPDPASS